MSEFQYYEFLAIDRPLTEAEQTAVRSLSTRARITATSFVNEYHWGNFAGNPRRMVERYYDAHLYFANWGTHQVMFRLPRTVLDLEAVEDYCIDNQVTARTAGEHVVLDFTSEDESGEFAFDFSQDPETLLSSIVAVRAELAAGDLRPLYLAWLASYGAWERDEAAFPDDAEDDLEAPLPPGLGSLSAAQRALADFLRLDADLLAVAAAASPPLPQRGNDPRQLAEWIAGRSAAEKNRLLQRVAEGEGVRVGMELQRRFHEHTTPNAPASPRRTVAELLDGAARRRHDRKRKQAEDRARAEARRKQALAEARERRLDQLAGTQESAWASVEMMIDTRRPAEYDAAVALLADLQALADRDEDDEAFRVRVMALRQQHARKPSLIQRMDRALIGGW